MDPLTQGVVGATASLGVASRKHLKVASVLGLLGGMAPDLDVLIRSEHDPLLFLEFHRHFTHALLFIPIAGLILSLLLFPWVKKYCSYLQTYAYVTLGYATHGLLDACTTYGTQLFWPLSDERVAWNIISVIDPLFTLPLLVLLLLLVGFRWSRLSVLACGWVVLYLGLGLVQQQRAISAAESLAEARGHAPVLIEAKPSFGNLLVWKTIYSLDGKFYVDAVRAGRITQIIPGESIDQLDLNRDFAWLETPSQQAIDVERFRWFSNDYLAQDPHQPLRIIDIRYSMLPHQATGLWGVRLSPEADSNDHVQYEVFRRADDHIRQQFWQMITGQYFAAP